MLVTPLPKLRVVPFTVRLPPNVVSPVPVVIALLFTVFKLNAVGLSIKMLPVDAEPIFKL